MGGPMTDYLILGGGSAGCVLTARLSEEPRLVVALIEAGRDIILETTPPAIRSRYPGRAYLDTSNIWAALRAYIGAPPGNRDERTNRRYEQARLLGGGSAINALLANRGSPNDYDECEAQGVVGWSWDKRLPYFLKLERDCDLAGPLHGRDGPPRIWRTTPDSMSPFALLMRSAVGPGADVAALSIPTVADRRGVGPGNLQETQRPRVRRLSKSTTALVGPRSDDSRLHGE
jgi:5-(hydroxymethyl)furfural/furfural oxidase